MPYIFIPKDMSLHCASGIIWYTHGSVMCKNGECHYVLSIDIITGPSGADLIYNKATFMSLFASIHFIIVCWKKFTHDSTYPLLRQWYNDDITWFVQFNAETFELI